ncbi:MAG: hypothetical protein Q7R64_04470 [bacterium]|nr:hypothetical protein [bacterium]
MERTPKIIIGISVTLLVALGLGIYAYFQSWEYLQGPVLTVIEPLNGSTSTTSLVTLLGNARNVAFLTLNGRQIFTNEQGRFRESLLLPKGYSIMTLEGKDRFGHSVEKRLELVYKPEQSKNENSKMENGTTTAPQF